MREGFAKMGQELLEYIDSAALIESSDHRMVVNGQQQIATPAQNVASRCEPRAVALLSFTRNVE